MRYLLLFLVFLVIISIPMCKEDPERYKPDALRRCDRAWRDSGLKWRLSPYKAYMNSDTLAYVCQINVDGRWVDEDHVKIEPR